MQSCESSEKVSTTILFSTSRLAFLINEHDHEIENLMPRIIGASVKTLYLGVVVGTGHWGIAVQPKRLEAVDIVEK